ncbi:MAG: copper chaperone PCu(A)C [Oceanospirillaceae bacterium]|nr:copper chaperone PCu(A)C [Oceanospirillaceae bacterium]MCP5335976.1 copper chaperone PCu(A)C [Oceanospirillaceae bacterium]MCP5350920.1 copper chaperone PCu(A)C [Oceanospirillaceae bacterium]
MRISVLFALILLCLPVHAGLILEEGYVRGLPPGQNNTAAFLTLKNTGSKTLWITAAQSDVAQSAELHQHSMSASGVMSMSAVGEITIPAGQRFTFAPGGYHIMLFGLHHPLRSGDMVKLDLTAGDGTVFHFQLPVVSVLDEKPAAAHQH